MTPLAQGDEETSIVPKLARHTFRLLTRSRGGYEGAVMYDVQLQIVATGALVWAHSFSDEQEAERMLEEVGSDLDLLDDVEFRRKWGVPSTA